jgi:hypothetical protein
MQARGLKNWSLSVFFPFQTPILWHRTPSKPLRVFRESESPIQRGYSGRNHIDSLGESFSRFRSNDSGESRTTSLWSGSSPCKCAASGEARDLGRESAAPETVRFRRRSQIFRGPRLRLLGNSLLRARRRRFAQGAN